jgi:hypothetical protein
MQPRADYSKEGRRAKGLILAKKAKTPLENFKTPSLIFLY